MIRIFFKTRILKYSACEWGVIVQLFLTFRCLFCLAHHCCALLRTVAHCCALLRVHSELLRDNCCAIRSTVVDVLLGIKTKTDVPATSNVQHIKFFQRTAQVGFVEDLLPQHQKEKSK